VFTQVFTGHHRFHRTLHFEIYTGIYKYSQVFTGIYRYLQVFTGLHRYLHVFTGVYSIWIPLYLQMFSDKPFTGIHRYSQNLQVLKGIYRYL